MEHFDSVFAPERTPSTRTSTPSLRETRWTRTGLKLLAYALGASPPSTWTRSPTCRGVVRMAGFLGMSVARGGRGVNGRRRLPYHRRRTTMVAFFLNYDERRAGVLDDEGFAGLYQGLLDAGYDLGSLEDLLAEMGGTSFRDFVGWFEGSAPRRTLVLTSCARRRRRAVDARDVILC